LASPAAFSVAWFPSGGVSFFQTELIGVGSSVIAFIM